ncbi:Ribosomal RNA small subunit methyltransferase F [Novipirellula aureliae]|uniref:Ribosomal RNA small subunit methyltransferase F n=1 Tax=Novipirellula aureliae TaxID=2527966 RepID=A0A5C6DWA6_9BACT|nr:SAM-dependent methyltransferase [Novipirellula aureliae]TWU41673.1 Ribosomal RNA small subunit methyltransferase F [Novipirellula aureliae]
MSLNIQPFEIEAILGDVPINREELGALATSLGRRFDNVLRLRPNVPPSEIKMSLDPIDWYSLGYRNVCREQRPSKQLSFALGDYYLQDAGSLLALAAAQVDTDKSLASMLVCDLCAAPGGKASAVAEVLDRGGFLLANEPIRSRTPPLLHNLARTGSDRFAVSSLDPKKLAQKIPGVFDIVLVDAPCSGQALVGRNRQSEAAFSQKQIEHSASRQRRILAAAKMLLKPGGRIIYSTCTFAAAENEEQVEWMINSLGLLPSPIERLDQYAASKTPASYRIWPHRHACAGSFAASLSLPLETSGPTLPRLRKSQPVKPEADLSQWYNGDLSNDRYFGSGVNLYSLPSDAPDWVENVAVAGAEIAYKTGKVWKPAHAGALRRDSPSTNPSLAIDYTEVDSETAQTYLSGATIANSDRGWSVVMHANRPLGWIKSDGRVGKNHLPTASRWHGQTNQG